MFFHTKFYTKWKSSHETVEVNLVSKTLKCLSEFFEDGDAGRDHEDALRDADVCGPRGAYPQWVREGGGHLVGRNHHVPLDTRTSAVRRKHPGGKRGVTHERGLLLFAWTLLLYSCFFLGGGGGKEGLGRNYTQIGLSPVPPWNYVLYIFRKPFTTGC